jgi:CRP-like cAMP-binding protein
MNTRLHSVNKPSVKGLLEAIVHNTGEDSLGKHLTPLQWEALEPFLQSFTLAQSQILIGQGAIDRTVYFLEAGSLTVHFEDATGRVHIATVNAGSAVGEGAFFSQMPRNATVQAVGECRLWSLTFIRFVELSQKQPKVALALAMALGAIISRRMANRRKRVSVT